MKKTLWPEVRQFSGESYEDCVFMPIEKRRDCPSYFFGIRTERGKGGPVILTLELVISPDEKLREFIRNHSNWRKEPRPLLLFCVQDFFWHLKLVTVTHDEPFTFDGGIVDSRSRGTLHMHLEITRNEPGDDATIVPLVNYANTHIYDQLEASFRQNPDAEWTGERVAEVKEAFYRSLEEKKHITAHERAQRHSAWKKSGEEWHYFLDESGELGFRNTSDVFITAGIGVRTDKVERLRSDLRSILSSVWGKQPPPELHFNKIPKTKRESVSRSIAEAFRAHGADAICYIMQKRNLLLYALRCEAEARRREERPIVTTLQYFLADPNLFSQAFFIALCMEEMASFIGFRCMSRGHDRKITHDRKHWDWQNEALARGFANSEKALADIANDYFGQLVAVNSTFGVAESQNEPCVWVADWMGWELSRWLENEDVSPGLASCFAEMTIVCFDDRGQRLRIDQPGGKILEKFPDWPREIPRAAGAELPKPLQRDEEALQKIGRK